MGKRVILITAMIFLVFLMTFVSAESIESGQVGQDKELYQTCNNCTFCNITNIKNNFNQTILSNLQFTESPDTYYSYILGGGNLTEIGDYSYCYYCGNAQQSETGCINFKVTADGFSTDLSKTLVDIIFLAFFIALMVGFHEATEKINFKRWNDSIIQKYEDRNFVKVVLSSMAYNVMKNVYLIYYLLGLPIMLILMNLAYIYNIATIITFMRALFVIYLVGVLIVGIVFLGYVQEWFMNMVDLLRDMDFGVEELSGGMK